MRLLHRLTGSKFALWTASVLLLAAVAVFHWMARREYEVAIFDLVPISLCAWHLGFPAGLAVSALAALTLLGVDLAGGIETYSHPTVPFWNNWMRFGIFSLVANLVARVSESSAYKSKVLSLVTHEFNHALTVIGVALSLLEKGDAEAAADPRRALYQSVRRQYASLRQVVSNFLSFNRLQSGRFDLRFKPADVRALTTDCLALLEPVTQQKGLAVAVEIPEGAAPVKADPDALALVLSNLIGNAVKFTDRGGKVTIRLGPGKEEGRVRLSVEDTGVGIGVEDQERIRTGVYGLETSTLTAPQTAGLGLRLVEELLRSHGTELTIQSWPEQGSTFSFELPPWSDRPPAASANGSAGRS